MELEQSNGNSTSGEIKDDTDPLKLADRVDFQTLDKTDKEKVDAFVNSIESIESIESEKRSPSSNPYVKTGIGVGVASLFLFLAYLTIPSDVSSGENVEAEEKSLTLSLEDDPSQESNPSELEKVKSELALMQQQIELADVDRDDAILRPPVPPVPVRAALPPPPPASATSPTPRPSHPRASSSPPRAVAASRPTRATPPPPTRTAAAIQTPPTPVEESVDPNERWEEASNLGSLGSFPTREGVIDAQQLSIEEVESMAAVREATQSSRPQEEASQYQLTGVSGSSNTSTPGLIEPDAADTRIGMGQRIQGSVLTPIAWIDTEDKPQYLIELLDDVLYSSGGVAIQSGSSMIVQTVEVNPNNGLGQLVVIGALIDGTPYAIQAGAIGVNGENGDPLVAEKFSNNIGNDIARSDMELFLVGAVGEIGSLLNRPNSEVNISTDFGASSSTEYDDPNILGAVLEGGTEQISGRMQDRNNDRYDALLDQESIFYLEEGAKVEFYINQEFQF